MYTLLYSFLATGLVATASASDRHGHQHNQRHEYDKRVKIYVSPLPYTTNVSSTAVTNTTSTACGCSTYTTTWYGEPGLVIEQPTMYASNTTVVSSTTSSSYVQPTTYSSNSTSSSAVPPLPVTTSSSTSFSAPPPPPPSPSTSSRWSSSLITSSSSSSVWTSSSAAPPSTSSTSSTSSTLSTSSSTWIAPLSYVTTPTVYGSPSPWAAQSSSLAWSSTAVQSSGEATSSSAAPSFSSVSSGSISSNGNQWAMAYTPYASDGTCKSADAVSSDIATIKAKGFTSVRLYATDCSGPQNIGSACKANGLKMILGVFIDGSGIGGKTDEQVSTLTKWGPGNWDMVEMVVFGNEAIFNKYADASQLANAISDARNKFRAAGYNGPVTTTDTVDAIQSNAGTLCGVIDVVAANIHPFFNGQTVASKAGDFVASQLSDLKNSCGGQKEAYNLETGWPSQGGNNGVAIPDFNDQKTAITSILSKAGSRSVMFSFENDYWKAPGDLGVEQYWGCANLFSG